MALPKNMSNPRHQLIALMKASGASIDVICEKLGYKRQTIEPMLNSDLFKATIAEYQRNIRQMMLTSIAERVDAEANPSLDMIISLRDGNFEDPRAGKLQLEAAKFILGDLYYDRRQPKIQRQETDTTIRVQFNGEVLRQMARSWAEDEGRAIKLEQSRPFTLEFDKQTQQPIDVEELIEDLDAREKEEFND